MANGNEMAGANEAPALPDFVPGTYYDVQLSRQVEFPPGSGTYMRPGETHHWEGAFCETMRDAISGAIAIAGEA